MAQSPYQFAASMLGKREKPNNAEIRDYLTTGGANLDPATTAWCAAYVNASLGKAGIKGTGSNLARSFLNWGQSVNEPQKGDIAVFSRGDPNGPYGHVGFFDGIGPDGRIRVLGGNQGDAVSIASYDPSRLLGYRRAATGMGVADSGTPQPTAVGMSPAASMAAMAQQGQPQQTNWLSLLTGGEQPQQQPPQQNTVTSLLQALGATNAGQAQEQAPAPQPAPMQPMAMGGYQGPSIRDVLARLQPKTYEV